MQFLRAGTCTTSLALLPAQRLTAARTTTFNFRVGPGAPRHPSPMTHVAVNKTYAASKTRRSV
jgi:hypothetical protein